MKQFWLPLAAGIACLATSGAWAQDVTLRVWDSYTEKADQFDAIIAAFEEAHPNIKVERNVQATADVRAVMQTALNSGTGPDVFYYDTGKGYAGVLAQNNLLLPLDDMYDGGSLSHIFPWARAAVTFDGKTIGIGTGVEFIGVYYNKPMFAELGLEAPKTYADYLAVAQALKDAGHYPVALGNSETYPAFHTFSAYVNARVPKDELLEMIEGKKSWDDPRVVDAIQKGFVDMMASDFYSPSPNAVSYNDANSLFSAGEAGMDLTGSWMIGTFKDNPFDTGIFFLPSEDGNDPRPPAGLGGGWFVSAKTAQPEAAKEFVSFLFDPANAHYWIETMSEIPAYPVDVTSMEISPLLAFTLDVIANESVGYNVDVMTPESFNTVMADGFQAVIAGDRTAAEQAAALQASMP